MSIESDLKRISLKIKHGRWEGVENQLKKMLAENRGKVEEIPIIEVYALEYLPGAGLYAEAIPELERILVLEVSEATKLRALHLLKEFKEKAAIVPSVVSLDKPEFLECIEFIRSEKSLLFQSKEVPRDEYEVIEDIDTAKKIAWHQDIGRPFMSWNSLREISSANTYLYADERKIDIGRLDSFRAEISKICERKLPPSMLDFFDDIYGDLSEILLGKALGFLPDLYEKMWVAYQDDLFPCGWKGEYPQGRLCIYVP